MYVEIVADPLTLVLYGVSGRVEGKQYGVTGQRLMDSLWEEIRAKEIKHRGINHWVYEGGEMLFTGVELDGPVGTECGLVRKEMIVPRYAYAKHVGPVSELGSVYQAIHDALRSRGLRAGYPAIEIYGHWTEDESQMETEIIAAID